MRITLPLILILLAACTVCAQQNEVLTPLWNDNIVVGADPNTRLLGLWIDDVNGDKYGEIVAVTSSIKAHGNTKNNQNHVYVYLSNGSAMWKRETDDSILDAKLFDINNDKKNEVIVSSGERVERFQRGTITIYGGDGSKIGSYPSSAMLNILFIGDLDGDRYYELGGGSTQRVFLMRTSGDQIWMYPPYGDPLLNQSVDALRFYDVDNDGLGEVIAGSDELTYLDARGKEMGSIDVEPEIQQLNRGFKYIFTGKYIQNQYPTTIAITSSNKVVAVGVDKVDGRSYTEDGVTRNVAMLTLSLKWTYDARCNINDASMVDLDDQGRSELLIACSNNKVYAIGNNGLPLWDYLLDGEPKSLILKNIEDENISSILVAVSSGSIYMLDEAGNFRWRYESGTPLLAATSGKMNPDNQVEVATVSKDYTLQTYVLNETYTLRRRADTLFNLGQEAYIHGQTQIALNNFKEAKDVYIKIGYQRGVINSQSYISKIEGAQLDEQKKQADIYYQKAQDLFFSGDYTGSKSFADKAQEVYKQFSNQEGIVKCELLKLQIERQLGGNVETDITLPETTSTTLPQNTNLNSYAYPIFAVLVLIGLAAIYLRKRGSKGNPADETLDYQEDSLEGQRGGQTKEDGGGSS